MIVPLNVSYLNLGTDPSLDMRVSKTSVGISNAPFASSSELVLELVKLRLLVH